MRRRQWIIFGSTILLGIVAFSFNNYTLKKKETAIVSSAAVDSKKVYQMALSQLNPKVADSLENLLNEDDLESAALVLEQTRKLDAAVTARVELLSKANDKDDLLFNARKIVNSLRFLANQSVKQSAISKVEGLLNNWLKDEPNNLNYLILMAGLEIEGKQDVMSGVTLLKRVVAEDPDNMAASFQLGRLSIQSGQFEKAVQRFEVVLGVDPNSVDALLYMSEAQMGLGEKAKALEYLIKAAESAENPAIKEEIKKYIERIS